MPQLYSFTPEDRYAEYHSRRKKRVYKKRTKDSISWKAPEHARLTSDMVRDFPRDDFGLPLAGSKKEHLVLERRPQVLIPERKTYLGWL